MTLDEATRMLLEAHDWSTTRQMQEARALIEAFRVMWRSRPTEAEFARLVSNVVIQPEMSYIMARE